MKKFNKSKVIIPALAMIALSTAASATGTVAWFAANNSVTATGMSFTASASANLFIGASTITDINNLTTATINLNTNFPAIKPCTLTNSSGTVTVKNATSYQDNDKPSYDNAGTAKDYEVIGTITADKSTDNVDPAKDLDDHIAHAHVRIARKQNPKAYFALTPKVTLKFETNSPLNKALRAAWIIGSTYENLVGDNGMTDQEFGTGEVEFTGTPVEHLADNELIDVALMVWYEGSDEDCKTASAINIKSCSAEWTFTSTDSTAPTNP